MKISKNTYIGLFVFLVIVVFVWGFNFLKGHRVFGPKRYYYAVYERVGGLIPSSKITLSGVKIGQVEEVNFDTTDFSQIIVKLYIDQEIKIPQGSIAKIKSSDLMGTKEIELILKKSGKLHSLNDTLTSVVERELADQVNAQIAPLKIKAEELIGSFDSVIVGVQSVFTEQTINDLKQSFHALSSTISQIDVITNDIKHFLDDEKKGVSNIIESIDSVTYTLKQNSSNINNVISDLSNLTDTISELKLKEMFSKASMAFDDLSEVAEKLNSEEGSLGKLINDDDLYLNLEQSSKELQLLLEDIRENPDRYIHLSVFGRKDSKASQEVE